MRSSLNKVFAKKYAFHISMEFEQLLAAASREKELSFIIQILKDVGLLFKDAGKTVTCKYLI